MYDEFNDGICTTEQAIVVTYRSLSAEDIGWYQCLRDGENNVIGSIRAISYVISEHFKPIEDLALYNAQGRPNF